jgi:hypothetical protein
VTATDLDIRNLTVANDAVYAHIRLLGGSCGDEVGITGAAWKVIEKFDTAITSPSGGNRLRTDDASGTDIKNALIAMGVTLDSLNNKVDTAESTLGSGIKVSVVGVAQPTGITSGKIAVPINTSAATQLSANTLQSGVHFKSDLVNTSGTIFIGSGPGVTAGNGYPLYNGDQIFIETDNTNRIYVSATAAGLTLYYIGT